MDHRPRRRWWVWPSWPLWPSFLARPTELPPTRVTWWGVFIERALSNDAFFVMYA